MVLITAMGKEVQKTAALEGLDPGFRQRLLVRVIFSTFEGYAFHLRQRALEIGQANDYEFSKTAFENLTEQKEVTKDDGTVEMKQFFLGSLKGLKFSIAIFAKVLGVPEPPSPKAGDLEAGFSVRDRLTHPKRAASFNISESEAQVMVRLGGWFSTVVQWYSDTERAYIRQVSEKISASIAARRAEIEAELKKDEE